MKSVLWEDRAEWTETSVPFKTLVSAKNIIGSFSVEPGKSRTFRVTWANVNTAGYSPRDVSVSQVECGGKHQLCRKSWI